MSIHDASVGIMDLFLGNDTYYLVYRMKQTPTTTSQRNIRGTHWAARSR